MLEGRYLEGAKVLSKYANTLPAHAESKAEHLFDAGFAYRLGGDKVSSAHAWFEGRRLDPSNGNKPWHRLIDDALQTLG